MVRNIGKIGCFKIVKFWQLTKGFVWNQIFLQPRLPSSGFIERFKSFKNTETCVKIWSFMFSRQQSADWAGVYVWSVGVLLLFYNKIHLILAPLSRLRLGQSWPHFHIPLHQHLIRTTHKKDCIWNDQYLKMNAVLTNEEFFDKLHPNKEFVNIKVSAGGSARQQDSVSGCRVHSSESTA